VQKPLDTGGSILNIECPVASAPLCMDSLESADLKRHEKEWLWRAIYDENLAKCVVSPSHSANGYCETRYNVFGTGGYNQWRILIQRQV
jgi:hypothetical protein